MKVGTGVLSHVDSESLLCLTHNSCSVQAGRILKFVATLFWHPDSANWLSRAAFK